MFKEIRWRAFSPNRFFFCSSLTLDPFFSGISTKISLWCRQNCFLSVHCNTLWQNNFLSKMIFSHHFRTFRKKISVFFIFSVNLTEVHSTSPKDHFEDISLFLTKSFLFISCFSENERRNNCFSRQKTISRFVTTAYHVSKNIFCFFFGKALFSSLGIERVFLSFRQNVVGRVISNAFCVSIAKACGVNSFVEKFFLPLFSDIDRKFISLCSFLFNHVDDTAFYESKGSIWGQKTVLSKLCLLHLSFAYLEGKSQGFFQKTVSRFVKTAYHVSKMILWRSFFWKSSFFISSFGFERAFLVLCTNFCGSGCQYCFLCVN